MLHLYDSPESGNCYKIRLLFSFLELPYEATVLSVTGDRDKDRGPAFFAKNPVGKIPTVVLEDGTAIGESMAILWHFARGTDWLPDDPMTQTRILQWMSFEQNNIEPSLATSRHKMMHGYVPGEELLGVWQSNGNRALGVLDSWLSEHDWLVGDRPTIADIACLGYTECCDEGPFDLEPYSSLRAWFERIRALDGFVAR